MFNPNLIIIKDKDLILGIHKIKVDYTKENYELEVVSKSGDVIFKGQLNNTKFIELDISLEYAYVNYYKFGKDKAFLKEEIDLKNINTYSSNRKTDTEYLKEKVQYHMDNPEGSIEEIEYHTLMLKKSSYDKKARKYVEEKIRQILLKEDNIKIEDVNKLAKDIYADLYGMGILQDLDDSLDIAEIMVNAYPYPKFRCDIYYVKTNEKKKRYHKTFNNLDDMLNIFARAISFSKKELNNLENATIETTRANGDRISVIIPEASESYILNIRKFSNFIPSRENMLKVGTINEDIDNLMKVLVKGKANIGIGGEMSTGKTTFINYLLTYTDPLERKAVIANVKEINSNRILDGHDIIFLNVDNEKGFTFEKQMRAALRTTADRIIVPEARGEEFKQVYEANLKTKGNLFTAHATSDETFLDACVDMYIQESSSDISFIKNKIAKSIDIIVIMKKINNQIRIKSISEVLFDKDNKFKGLNLLYCWDFEAGKYKRTNNKLSKDIKRRLFEEGVPKEMMENI